MFCVNELGGHKGAVAPIKTAAYRNNLHSPEITAHVVVILDQATVTSTLKKYAPLLHHVHFRLLHQRLALLLFKMLLPEALQVNVERKPEITGDGQNDKKRQTHLDRVGKPEIQHQARPVYEPYHKQRR
jgi:hypothetical protein